MRLVLRWGRSAYETDTSLDLERAAALGLGFEWHLAPDRSEPDALARADVLVVTSGVRVSRSALSAFTGDLVVTTTSGFDHIDVPAAADRGVRVARLPMARRDAVVEHALGALITLMRRLPDLDVAARRGVWARGDLPRLAPTGIDGSTIAVVGCGVIGRRMCGVLSHLGARVVAVDPAGTPPGVESADIDEAIADADAVTLHCALSDTSRGLMSAARLDALRPGAVVVNTARGAVLDVGAAVAAVEQGHLRGLAVDVFPNEPWPELSVATPRVLFTPHASGYTSDLGERVAKGVSEALAAYAAGHPIPHLVTPVPDVPR